MKAFNVCIFIPQTSHKNQYIKSNCISSFEEQWKFHFPLLFNIPYTIEWEIIRKETLYYSYNDTSMYM